MAEAQLDAKEQAPTRLEAANNAIMEQICTFHESSGVSAQLILGRESNSPFETTIVVPF